MFGKIGESTALSLELLRGQLIDVNEKLDSIIHDLQQIKTSQRASQKRERKIILTTKKRGRPKKV